MIEHNNNRLALAMNWNLGYLELNRLTASLRQPVAWEVVKCSFLQCEMLLIRIRLKKAQNLSLYYSANRESYDRNPRFNIAEHSVLKVVSKRILSRAKKNYLCWWARGFQILDLIGFVDFNVPHTRIKLFILAVYKSIHMQSHAIATLLDPKVFVPIEDNRQNKWNKYNDA